MGGTALCAGTGVYYFAYLRHQGTQDPSVAARTANQAGDPAAAAAQGDKYKTEAPSKKVLDAAGMAGGQDTGTPMHVPRKAAYLVNVLVHSCIAAGSGYCEEAVMMPFSLAVFLSFALMQRWVFCVLPTPFFFLARNLWLL